MNNQNHQQTHSKKLGILILGAIGVVFGDIGTSPLYALKLSIESAIGQNHELIPMAVFGILSLIIWSLILVVTIKYVFIIMRADNHGEGGVFALTALICNGLDSSSRLKWVVTIIGTIGAALFFGDSMITPAISVLSAVEGLNVISPSLNNFIIPISLTLITGLFAIERMGTGKVGAIFGPIMLLWFSSLGLMGLLEVINQPAILLAFNPITGIRFLLEHSTVSLVILGSVVLAVTGGEALYADMGHFGRKPINIAWLWIVFPCLVLNYLGQGALLLRNPSALDNPFYRIAPEWGQIPLLILASCATLIASQAVISGTFSLASQAVQMGYIPRIRIKHTSSDEEGQVYLSKINILLFVGVICLILGFKTSEKLAAAYGIAVIAAMAIDSILAGFCMYRVKKWPLILVLPLFLGFFFIDGVYLVANLTKFFEGGWVPSVIAGIISFIMVCWIIGRERLLRARWDKAVTLENFLKMIKEQHPIRVPGTAIYMVTHPHIAPLSMLHNYRHNKVLHERVIFMHVETVSIPNLKDADRIEVTHLDENMHIAHVKYGYMEEPNIPRVLAFLRVREFHFSLMEISFFVGNERVVAKKSSSFATHLFIIMHRSMLNATESFKIPAEHVVELSGNIRI
jgi:KUP system potassium uptake protein